MARISFDAVVGCVGRYDTDMTMILSGPVKKLKKILTVSNKSAKFKLRQAERAKEFFEKKLAALANMSMPEDSPVYVETQRRIDVAAAEIPELEEACTEFYFSENADGTLTVPAGMWWLCERVEGNFHRNTDVAPYYLPGLRDYQKDALTELYKYKRGTLELATGLGKSKLVISTAYAGVQAGKRVMVVVPTEYLVKQMYLELKELHPNTTAIGGDYKHPKLGWDIMVITIHSAHKYLDEAEMLLVDEGHHSSATTWVNMHTAANKVTHCYNFTATAFRSDGLDMGIHAFGGPIVYARDGRWGIDNGWLSPLKVIQIRIRGKRQDGSPVALQDGVMAAKAYKAMMGTPNIMDLIAGRITAGLAKKHRIMCVFKTVKAAEVFRKHSKMPFKVAHADKKLSKYPKAPLDWFNDKKTDLLVACDKLISEGINIPDSTLLICCTQHSGDVTTFQLVGRVLRKSPGKSEAIVVDIAVLGYSQYERAADKRLAIYRYLTDNVTVVDL